MQRYFVNKENIDLPYIYITGDGIANFKGAKNILKDITGHNIYDYKIPFNNTKDKFQTSKMGLAALANIVI